MTPDTSASDFHLTLRTMIDLLIPGTSTKAQQIFNDDLSKEKYTTYLIDLYHIVVGVCPMMRMALEQLSSKNDPECQPLIGYFERHLEEEFNHEAWILEDLDNLGVDYKAALAELPKPQILNLVGSMYYRILHLDPCAMLGYLAVGETYPVSQTVIDTIKRVLGVDANCVNALQQHVTIDIDHVQHLYQFIASIDWSERQKSIMLDCAKTTIFNMIEIAQTLETP